MAAASLLKVVEQKPIEKIDDQTLIMADLSRKAIARSAPAKLIAQVQRFVRTLLKDDVPQQKIDPANTEKIIEFLTTGQVTHDYPITVEEATELGLPITVGLPPAIYNLMELYPQPQGGRPSVQYIPYQPRPALPEPKGRPLPDQAQL